MGEKELGQRLLELDARTLAGEGDPREQTWRIIDRDRRRVWWLTALTITLWIGTLLMVLWMLVAMGLLMPLEAKLRGEGGVADAMPAEMRAAAEVDAQVMFRMITVGIAFSVGVLALAAGSTVLLVLATRRATLRQINASLLEISEQLKQLRQLGERGASAPR